MDAGLRYVSDLAPGITRKKRGKGFSYEKPDGTAITDPQERARIASIAIPPAWTDVWICPTPDGHILATGRDARGRKQYRYHPRWREVRDADKFESLAEFGAAAPRPAPSRRRRPAPPRPPPREGAGAGGQAARRDPHPRRQRVLRRRQRVLRPHHPQARPRRRRRRRARLRLRRARAASTTRCTSRTGAWPRSCTSATSSAARTSSPTSPTATVVDVTSSDVNDYLAELAGPGVTAKTSAPGAAPRWRPARSPSTARRARTARPSGRSSPPSTWPPPCSNNTRAVCRSCYVHPVVPDSYRSGELQEVWKRSRDGGELDRGERTVLKLLTGEASSS